MDSNSNNNNNNNNDLSRMIEAQPELSSRPIKQSFAQRIRLYDRILWIFAAFFLWYLIIGDTIAVGLMSIFERLNVSNAMHFVLEMYTVTIGPTIAFVLICFLKRNRKIGLDMLPTRKNRAMYMLLMGLLLGFLMNFACILCALLHGDIKLHFDFSADGIPLMLFAFVSVFIQSSSEEMWTRGFMYERIDMHYPLWVAIVVNGTIFGLLHSFNPGITALAMADLIICGISFSLLRWYSGSIWTCFGVHTMWNFTQNLIFGLPNSGLVSEASIFKMDAVNAVSNWVYSYEFGVEGAVPALLIDAALGAGCLYLGWRAGRIGELFESKEKAEAVSLEFIAE